MRDGFSIISGAQLLHSLACLLALLDRECLRVAQPKQCHSKYTVHNVNDQRGLPPQVAWLMARAPSHLEGQSKREVGHEFRAKKASEVAMSTCSCRTMLMQLMWHHIHTGGRGTWSCMSFLLDAQCSAGPCPRSWGKPHSQCVDWRTGERPT